MKTTIKIAVCCVVAVIFTISVFATNANSQMYFEGDGSPDNPYLVKNAADLIQLSYLVNSGDTHYACASYLQTQDILLNGEKYTPIGTNEHPFTGNYNGNKRLIEYTNSVLEGNYGGLFGYAKDADFHNIILEINLTLTNNGTSQTQENNVYLGGLCGLYEFKAVNKNTSISGCAVYGTLQATSVESMTNAGGLFGKLSVNTSTSQFCISDCYSNTELTGYGYTGTRVGGIVGDLDSRSTYALLERCVVKGNIKAINKTNNHHSYCGGLVGCFTQDQIYWSEWVSVELYAQNSNIENCIVDAELSALCGDNPGDVGVLCCYQGQGFKSDEASSYFYKDIYEPITSSANKLDGTHIQSKESLYDPDFLQGTLGFDMTDTWLVIWGEILVLRDNVTQMRIFEKSDKSSVYIVSCGTKTANATIISAYYFSGVLSKTVLNTFPLSEPMIEIPLSDTSDTECVTFYMIDIESLKPNSRSITINFT